MASKPQPWAVLVCRPSDDTSDPAKVLVNSLPGINNPDPNDHQTVLELFNMFLTAQGNNTFNAVRYFNEMSHGSIDLNDSQVFVVKLDLTKAQLTPPMDPPNGPAYEAMVTQAAQAAAINQNVPLENFYGIVITSGTTTLYMAQGGHIPGGAKKPNVIGWTGFDYRWVKNNGIEAWGQEMGHGYGLDHSRADGSLVDYMDRLDVMSTSQDGLNTDSGPDPDYGLRGPGINAWNMRGRTWLDETRVWHCPNNSFDQTLQLRPLHRKDLAGFLAAELPPMNDTDGFPRYLVEYRKKENWDIGIPSSCILVHRFEGPIRQFLGTHSYVMKGTDGQFNLVARDTFAPNGVMGPNLSVTSIDDNTAIATVRLTLPLATTNVALGSCGIGKSVYFFATSTDKRIFYNSAVLGHAPVGWNEVQGNGFTDAAPSAICIGNRVFVFVKGLDGNIFLNQAVLDEAVLDQGFLPQWIKVQGNGITDAAPSAMSIGNRIFVFIKGLDGNIFLNQAVLDQGFLPQWIKVQGNGITDAAPSAMSIGNRIFVFIKGLNGRIYFNQAVLDQGFLPEWIEVQGNGLTDAAPSAMSIGNRIFVFIKGLDGNIFLNQAVLDQGFLPQWIKVQGNGITDAAPSATSIENRIFVFIKGLDKHVFLNQAILDQGFLPAWARI